MQNNAYSGGYLGTAATTHYPTNPLIPYNNNCYSATPSSFVHYEHYTFCTAYNPLQQQQNSDPMIPLNFTQNRKRLNNDNYIDLSSENELIKRQKLTNYNYNNNGFYSDLSAYNPNTFFKNGNSFFGIMFV